MFAMRKDGRKMSVVDGKRPSIPTIGGRRSSMATSTSTMMPKGAEGGPLRMEVADGILQLKETIETPGEVMCLRFSPDCSVLAAGFADGVIKIYNAETMKTLFTLTNPEVARVNLPCTGIRFIGGKKADKTHVATSTEEKRKDINNILLSSYTSGFIRFWHYPTGECLSEIDEKRQSTQTMAVAVNFNNTSFVSVGADTQILIYDFETKKRVNTLEASDERDKMDGHKARVFAVQFHPVDPFVFITGGWDDTVQFWDTRKKRSFRRLYGPHICGDALDMDPSNYQILTGSWRREKSLEVWDFGSAEKVADIPDEFGGFSLLYCAQWFGKDHVVCGGTHRNRARVIDKLTYNTVGTLGELPQGVYCLDNDRSPTKLHLAVGALKKVYVMRVTNPTAITTGKKVTGSGLN